ncbi:myrosinase 1-like [Schistocerca nitens]|uniref:myrosinase 1-like n=1 Tax=Schistocerca nitens TaxID=7011 RepID=UPI002117490C|nr:myrosinase 1-like [Schistocerca nitens]
MPQATAYRFSISWPRVLPKGDLSVINQAGIDYYNNLINELLANGIQPVVGIFAHPIYSVEGDYPAVVRETVDNNSKAEGLARSGLPKFTQEEIEYIRGSADFFGLNTYGSQYTAAGDFPIAPSRRHDSGVITKDDEIPLDQSAAGFRKILNWVAAEYPGYPIFVSENGLGNDGSVGLNDTDRVEYFAAFLPALLQAVNLDNVPVVGYTCWSLMDTLEWQLGYSMKYGLYQVDFDSPDRTRTPKESAHFMSTIYGTRRVPEEYFR